MPLQKLLCQQKTQFYWMQTIFLSGTICKYIFGPSQKYGPAKNILGLVTPKRTWHLSMTRCLHEKFQTQLCAIYNLCTLCCSTSACLHWFHRKFQTHSRAIFVLCWSTSVSVRLVLEWFGILPIIRFWKRATARILNHFYKTHFLVVF